MRRLYVPTAVGLLAIAIGVPVRGAFAQSDTGPLLGLWGCETTFGPLVRGLLTLTRERSGWTASIAGFQVPAKVTPDSVDVQLPDSLGDFRGARRAGGTIEGFWIQPAGTVAGTPYATPVTLARSSP